MSERLTHDAPTAIELLGAFRARTLSPREVVETAVRRIDDIDGRLHAFCDVFHDEALEQAARSERRWVEGRPKGRLDGVPVLVKDVEATVDSVTRFGFRAAAAGPAREDSPSVRLLRAHGAVILGKTTTPQLGWKATTNAPGAEATRNPWDLAKTCGGSSGGSAAAVAAGIAPLGHGTDGGGSIRIPAAFCGLVGIKPTFGRVGQWPPSRVGLLAHTGPLARTVDDAALMLEVLSEPDWRDWASLPAPAPAEPIDVSDLRIAYSPTLGHVPDALVDPDVAGRVLAATQLLEQLGAHVEMVDPQIPDPAETFRTLWDASFAFSVAMLPDAWDAEVEPGLREVARRGHRLTALDWLAAEERRAELAVAMGRFHQEWDVLVTPTVPIAAFTAGLDVPERWPTAWWPSWTPFTWPFNLTQQPALTLPCGVTESGLPVGCQLIGARHSEALLLDVARGLEQAVSGSVGSTHTGEE